MRTRGAQRLSSSRRKTLSRDLILDSHLFTDGVTQHGMERSGPKHVGNVLPSVDTVCRDHHVIEVAMMNSLAEVVLAKNTTDGYPFGGMLGGPRPGNSKMVSGPANSIKAPIGRVLWMG